MFDQVGFMVLRLRTHYPKWDVGEGSDLRLCMVLLDVVLFIFLVSFMRRAQLELNPR
jgi:hypothetical protein